MPYFIKRLFHIHKYGCRMAFGIFGMRGGLSELKEFVVCRFVFPEARLLWIDFVVALGPVCKFLCDEFF